MPYNLNYSNNDSCNASVYARVVGEKLRFIPEVDKFFAFEGEKWGEDFTRKHVAAHKLVITYLEGQCLRIAERKQELLSVDAIEQNANKAKEVMQSYEYQQLDKQESELVKGIKGLRKKGGITAMIDLAKAEEGMSTSITDFDTKGHYLGVKNGVVDLRTRKLISNDSRFLITSQCGVDYDSDAECPSWIKLIDQVCEGNQDYISYIQRALGSALLGRAGKSKLIIFCGHGANGKSTVIDAVLDILKSYAVTTTAKAITSSQVNKEFYLASTRGARLVVVNELEAGSKLDEGTVKMMVDSGEVQARFPYGRPFSFQPVSTTIIATNYPPRISADYAINRRLAFIPFEYQIPKDERNPNFRQEVLEKEVSGILNWLIAGCLEYMRLGLDELPPAIQKATNEFIAQNDRIGQFVEEACAKDDTKRIPLKEFEERYSDWLSANNYKELGSDRVSNDLRSRSYEVKKSTGGRFCIVGLRFKSSAELRSGFVAHTFDPVAEIMAAGKNS